jgi:hypothetical protein
MIRITWDEIEAITEIVAEMEWFWNPESLSVQSAGTESPPAQHSLKLARTMI